MLTNHTLAAALAGWREAAAYRAATRRSLAACLARLQQRAQWSAWASWQAFVAERKLKQQRLAAVVQHWRQAALAKAWQVGGGRRVAWCVCVWVGSRTSGWVVCLVEGCSCHRAMFMTRATSQHPLP